MQMKYSAAWAVLALAISLGACDAISGKETPGQYVDDASITTRIKSAFAADPVVKAREVGVETLRGEVQLTGFVTSREEAARAVDIARKTEGVRGVRNSIAIR
jgi:hyperosmotically inducible periplasmic protein